MEFTEINSLFSSDKKQHFKRPLLIAGPCSAETEEQTLQTAIRLKKTNKVHVFRAGIWKPRTRPGAFEGVGAIGLPWLQKVNRETGLPVMVEVANENHVDLCLQHGINIFWIGARTTANPFAVQEIADAVKGKDVTVFIKNPVNPDLDLWLGGTERLINAGVRRIGAIHRGFFLFRRKIIPKQTSVADSYRLHLCDARNSDDQRPESYLWQPPFVSPGSSKSDGPQL
jgi:3-deoxy-D-arabino-heptulosonate 7-phosphate (DAHP) synthase